MLNTFGNKPKSRVRLLALHPMLVLHSPPVKGRWSWLVNDPRTGFYIWTLRGSAPDLGFSGFTSCPPASKEAESPSNSIPFLSIGSGWGQDIPIGREDRLYHKVHTKPT